MAQNVRPCLRVVGLHVDDLKALRRVDWPADGMAWDDRVPDLVMVGGVNGSGKTTLLELIASAAKMLRGEGPGMWQGGGTTGNAWVDLSLTSERTGERPYRIVFGDPAFVRQNKTGACTHFTRINGNWQVSYEGDLHPSIAPLLADSRAFAESDLPRIVHLPTDRRFELPNEEFKAPGDLDDRGGFYHRFETAKEWEDSLGAVLYGARWADLNAKEEGHPERATHFESYDRAFRAFFGEGKRLTWHEGKLVVVILGSGARHRLPELSSGEKQVLILAAELHRMWRPGSLILIDEPELHLHASWQTTLWTLLERLQKERGGQVIITTQSNHLFTIAEPGTTVLLGQALA